MVSVVSTSDVEALGQRMTFLEEIEIAGGPGLDGWIVGIWDTEADVLSCAMGSLKVDDIDMLSTSVTSDEEGGKDVDIDSVCGSWEAGAGVAVGGRERALTLATGLNVGPPFSIRTHVRLLGLHH